LLTQKLIKLKREVGMVRDGERKKDRKVREGKKGGNDRGC